MRSESIGFGGKLQNRMKRTSTKAILTGAATAACAGIAHGQANVPIAVSNWNADVVADSAPIASSTNYEFDTANTPYGGGVYYSTSYFSTGGIPLTPFVSASNSNTTFFVADTSPTANEAFMLNAVTPTGATGGNGTGGLSGEPFYTSGTVNLSSPGSYTGLSFLSAVSNGQAGKNLTVNVQLNFAGGVTATGLSFTGQDWTASSNYAVNAYNVNRGNTATTTGVGNPGGLLENDIAIPQQYQSLALQSVTFTMADTAAGNDWAWGLLALSGSVGSTGNFLWSGNVSTPSNPNTATWDVNSTPNFTGTVFNGSGTAVFGDVDGNGNPVVNSNVQISSGGVTPFNTTFNNSSVTYNVTGGAISGSGGVTMTGNGTTTLFNVSNFSGGTVVSSGTLVFANGGSVTSTLGTTNFSVGTSGTLIFAPGGEIITGNIAIIDNGLLVDNAPSRVVTSLTGTGVLQLNGTIYNLSSGGFTGIANGTGGFILSGSYNFGSGSGGVSNYSGGTVFQPGTDINAISNYAFGTGPLVFNNGGFQVSGSQFTINANNPFANPFTFGANPTMLIQGTNPVDISGNGTLVAGNNKISIATATVLSGTISDPATGHGAIVATGPGVLTLAGAGNSYQGGTNVASGTVVFNQSSAPFGGATYVAPGATLQLNTATGLGSSPTSTVTVASGGQMIVNDNSGQAGLVAGTSTPINTTVTGTGIPSAATGTNTVYGALHGPDGQSAVYAGNVIIGQGGAYLSGGVTGTLTLSGNITGSPTSTTPQLDAVVFSRANSSTTILSGQGSYPGETQMVADANIYSGGQATSTLQLGSNNAASVNSGFLQTAANGSADGLVFDLHGYNQSVAYISSAFHANLGSTTSNFIITNTGGGVSVLTISNGNTTVAGTGVGAVGPQTYANTIADSGSGQIAIVKTGLGTQILSGNNAYSGGTTAAGGILEANSLTALGTGTVTMAGGTLFLNVPQSGVASNILTGFSSFKGNKGSTGDGPTLTSSVATITDGTNPEANSVFSPIEQISTGIGFTANFTYTYTKGSTLPANGITFVIQNDPRGQSAVGGAGNSLGYTGSGTGSSAVPAVSKSGGIALNIYPGGTGGANSSSLATNGGLTSSAKVGSVSLSSGDPIAVSINYVVGSTTNVGTLTETLTDSKANTSYTATFSNVNFTSLLNGNAGYIGFTGSTLSSTAESTQQISGFSFGSYTNGPQPLANPFVTAPNTTSTLLVAVAPGVTDQVTGPLTINPGSDLILAANASSTTTRMVFSPSSVTFNTPSGSMGKIDLGRNDLDLPNASLSTITGYVAAGYNLLGGAKWDGPGITSSAAFADTSHLTALGVILNNANGTQLYGLGLPLGAFDGSNPGSSDVLVKYTYYGDANLDGKVDGSDYSLIDAGYAADKSSRGSVTGWYNGDFNYDGMIDGSDYALIDNAFNNQGAAAVSSALIASSTDQVAGAAVSPAAVPEPASLAAVAIGLAGLASRRRRSR